MRFESELMGISCPYCGEPIEIVVDLSVEQQDYVEDCSVCCRPMVIGVTATGEDATVTVRSEDE